jgi:hypothetical protein
MDKSIGEVILYILSIAKANKISSIKKTYLVKYVYYFDYLYAQEMGDKYTNIDWKLHYYGPHSFQIDEVLEQLIKSKKIGFSTYESSEYESISYYIPSGQYPSPSNFDTTIKFDIENFIKEHEKKKDLKALLHETYATEPMQNKFFGELLSFIGLEKLNYKKDIKSLKLLAKDEDKIAKVKSLLKKMSKKSKDADKAPLFELKKVPYSDFAQEDETSYINDLSDLNDLRISFSSGISNG